MERADDTDNGEAEKNQEDETPREAMLRGLRAAREVSASSKDNLHARHGEEGERQL